MSTVSRRTVLQAAGSMAIIGALGPGFAAAAAAAPNLTPAELEELRIRWVEDLTSRTTIIASPQTFTAQLAAMDRSVERMLTRISPTPTRYFDDLDWSLGATEIAKSNNMRLNYVSLQSMAVAWATPGSRYEASRDLLATVRAGLAHLHDNVYNPQTTWFGNWWSWLIGATRPLADIMAILRAELGQSEIDAYCMSMDHFLPNRDPRLQIHPNGVQESEGANRVDICRAMIVRSILQPDPDLLGKSIAALSPTWQYVTAGNGFFSDGSFIQHSTIGYTGTYGLVLLEGLAKLFALLAGTTFDIADPTKANLTTAIEGSYAPFMFNGQMMDAVRGRAVSRYAERSIDNGNQFIECTLRLAKAADATTAGRWRGLCRQWMETNSAATIMDTANIGRLALVIELLASDVAPVTDATGPRMFPAMDRLVYRGAGNTWAMCVAMCSRRISWNEGTGAENFLGVKTSQGMTYLYLADDDRHFDDEFWATFDLEAPPGATIDMTPLSPNPEGEWGGRTPTNEWTGGVTFENLALAGMHLVAPGGTGLVARKTWLTTPDRVIALGADISTQSSGAVRTIVEHRNLGMSTRSLVVDGKQVTGDLAVSGAGWAHLDRVGGYVFLGGAEALKASLAQREGTWRRNSTNAATGTDVVQRRIYATLSYEHGSGAEAGGSNYAYVILPRASRAATTDAARNPGVRVLRNDAVAQAVAVDAHVVAVNFWKPGIVGDYTSSSSMCLIVCKTPGIVRASLSDPTQQQDSVELAISQAAGTRVRGRDADRVRLTRTGGGVNLVIDTRGLAGRTLEFRVHR